jgi:U3 small nucleolar RNA-associated protein 10
LQLVARLSEEYLALLPETLPFLAELLEDAEHAVEARAAALLRSLESLSGESLEQYLR